MKWRSMIVGSIAGATAMWFFSRNQSSITQGFGRIRSGNWFGWMNKLKNTDTMSMLPDVMK